MSKLNINILNKDGKARASEIVINKKSRLGKEASLTPVINEYGSITENMPSKMIHYKLWLKN